MKKIFTLTVIFSAFVGSIAFSQSIQIGNNQFVTAVTYGPMNSGTTANSWNRHAYIYPASLFDGKLAHGDSIVAIHFSRGSTTNAIVGNPNFKIYIRNIALNDYGAGNINWVLRADSATLVWDGDPTTILGISPGFKRFDFQTGYIYDTTGGKSLEVLVQYQQPVGQTVAVNWGYDLATTVPAYTTNSTKYRNATTLTLDSTTSASNERHPTIIFEKKIGNNISAIYPTGAKGFLHLGKYPLSLEITNSGWNNQTSFNVSVLGNLGYSDTKTVASLNSGASTTVVFDSIDYSLASGYDSILYVVQLGTDQFRNDDTIVSTNFIFNPYTSMGIYNNGPIINYPGAGFNGDNNSRVESPLNSAGSNTNWANIGFGYRMADDFTVPDNNMSWTLDSLYFYTYQTGANALNPSTMTAFNVRIWDGIPDQPGSTVIAGDTVTNVMVRSVYSGVQRTFETTPLDATRPVMKNVIVVPSVTLNPGTYWIDWSCTGTIASGPWALPITVRGVSETGNGLQRVGTFAWQQQNGNTTILDKYQQGQPFEIFYTSSPLSVADQDLQNAKWSVYPNPSSGEVNVDFMLSKSSAVKVKLFDVMGREVAILADKNMSTGFNQLNWDASSLNTGIYILAVEMNGLLETKRLAINK